MVANMTDAFERGPLPGRRASGNDGDGDSVDLRELFRGIWQDKYIILASTIFCGIMAALLVSQVTPRYSSLAQVLLDPRERRVITNEQVVSDLKLSDQVMASELSIMRSNVLMQAVIAEIDQAQPGALDAIDPILREPTQVDLAKAYVKTLLKTKLGLGGDDEPLSDDILTSARVERLTWAIRRGVDLWRDGDAYVITILAETEDPELSTLLAGTIADQYVRQQLEGRRLSATQAADWLEKRVEELRQQVEIAEDAVEDYRARSLEDNGSSFDIITQRMVSLNDELVNARVERVAAESRYNEIERLIRDSGFEALGSMITSETIEDLNARRLAIKASDAQWAERFGDNHPERKRLNSQLAEVDRALVAEFQRALDAQRNDVQIARIREQTMRDSLDEAERQFLSISRSSIGLRQLEREAEAARNMYTDLLNRYAETRTQEQLQQADARIIERATLPGAPSAPRPKLMTMLGLMIGAAFGFAFVVFRQLTNTTYRTLSELVHDTGLPVLSAIPERKWHNLGAAIEEVDSDTLGQVAEGVRKLRNELSIGDDDSDAQTIALLSPLQDEGKTTTTVLLARLAEMANKLVIVVDCDFRQNSIQSEYRFQMEHDFGDLIRGDCSLLEAVNSDTGLGFDLLAARAPQPEAADLLTTGWLKSMLDDLKSYYDVVLVNCPAVLPVAETMVLARAVDQRVLLVRHAATSKSAVKRCLGMLDHNRLDVTGSVLTRVEGDLALEGYRYSYGYHEQSA